MIYFAVACMQSQWQARLKAGAGALGLCGVHPGDLCTFYNDTTLFSPGIPAAAVMLNNVASHRACCEACGGVWAAGRACRSFTWDATSTVCTLYRDDPNLFCDTSEHAGFVSGQFLGARGHPQFPLRSVMPSPCAAQPLRGHAWSVMFTHMFP